MRFQKKSKAIHILTAILTVCIAVSASLTGVYPAFASTGSSQKAASPSRKSQKSAASQQAQRYYRAGSLPLFQAVFSTLDVSEQKYWLNRIYADGEISFFSAALSVLDEDSPLIAKFAKKAYQDGETAFFSVLADCMDVETLKEWLDRAIDDGETMFQSILYDKLDPDDEKDTQEEAWAREQMKEYKKYGVTMKGKNYYYKDALVRVFYDPRVTFPAYTLNINPKGTVDIKVVRDKNDQIKKVSYMKKEEVKEILGIEADFEKLDELDKLDSLDKLDALDELDSLDALDKLDGFKKNCESRVIFTGRDFPARDRYPSLLINAISCAAYAGFISSRSSGISARFFSHSESTE